MAKPDITKLRQVNHISVLDIIQAGVEDMDEDDIGFEYVCGRLEGYDIKVSIERQGSGDISCFDGVDGFGLTLLYEAE